MTRIPDHSVKRATRHQPFGKSKPALNPDHEKQKFKQAFDAGQYELGKEIALGFITAHPQVAQAWSDVAACCLHLQQWDEAIMHATRALAGDPTILSAIDALSHAYQNKSDLQKTREFGHLALVKRDGMFGQKTYKTWTAGPVPGLSADRSRNIIAFSLFGSNPKYCEPGVLNVMDQSLIYPDWTCRFYVDETVPASVKERIAVHGGQVIEVDEVLKKWPGTMWRFAAYDDPNVDRVIFRDADAIFSSREADAVQEWVEEGQAFHMMRDSGSHTELILAGMWGCTRGVMPPMHDMISDYLKVEPSSWHYADQYFLREYVWPYARKHIMQHDSLFDFMNPRAFPEGPHRHDFQVGCTESSPYFEANVTAPDGSIVHWAVWDQSRQPEALVCRYAVAAKGGKIRANIPRRYAKRINADYVVRVELG